MTAIAFDTLKFTERLTKTGVPDAQAKAEDIRDTLQTSDLVTRECFDLRLRAELESAKSDIIKWIAGLLLAHAALVATLVKPFSSSSKRSPTKP